MSIVVGFMQLFKIHLKKIKHQKTINKILKIIKEGTESQKLSNFDLIEDSYSEFKLFCNKEDLSIYQFLNAKDAIRIDSFIYETKRKKELEKIYL